MNGRRFFSSLTAIVALMVVAMPNLAQAQDPPPIGTTEGEMYPDFRLPTLDGQLRTLSEFRGKKILLFNFASW